MMGFIQDPDSTLDYKWDWSDWLEQGETITVQSVVAEAGISVDSSAIADAGLSVTAWISGGTDKQSYVATCEITTSAGRVDQRSIRIKILER
jgi:hypothetical protein